MQECSSFNFRLSRELVKTFNIPLQERNATCKSTGIGQKFSAYNRSPKNGLSRYSGQISQHPRLILPSEN